MRFNTVGRILTAQALSSLGTSMSTVALAVMVLKLTGSPLQMGGIMAASVIPLVFTAWVGGAILDRYSARNVMVVADFVRAALIFSMPFAAGHYVWLAYVVAALLGTFSGMFNPGQIKLIGEIVEPRDLVKANSYLGVARDGAELVGYMAGAVMAFVSSMTILGVEISGYTLAFVVDALSYVASALLLVRLPRGLVREGAEAPSVRRLMAESPAVLARMWRVPSLRTNLLLALFASGAVMMNVPNSYVLAQQVFGRGALGLGALEVFVAAGLIGGGLLVSRMRLAGDRNRYVILSLTAMALCLVAVGFSPFFWLSVGLMGLAGAANVGMVVPSIIMFQEVPATAEKGRLIALRSSFGQLAVAAGFVTGGLLGQLIGIKPAFQVTGVATIVIALLIYVPYRVGASRRSRRAWSTAMQAGARRGDARALAHQAAYSGLANTGGGLGGPGVSATGWSAAEAVESNAGSEA